MSLSQFKVTADRPLFGYFASLLPVTMPALLPTVIKQISSKIVRPHVNIFCGMGSNIYYGQQYKKDFIEITYVSIIAGFKRTLPFEFPFLDMEIGRASCRERV